jgi:hypothetical protein
MTDDTRYNGWTNRPTWAAALHINNDYGMYQRARELTAEVRDDESIDAEDRADELADKLRDEWAPYLDPETYVSEIDPEITLKAWLEGPGMMAGDVGDADAVDWQEIAGTFLTDE